MLVLASVSLLLLTTSCKSAGLDNFFLLWYCLFLYADDLADGNNDNKMYPRLAGQYKNYLIHALNSYKSGERKNAIMSGFAAGLSSQDIVDLSTYYSKQKGLNIIPKN